MVHGDGSMVMPFLYYYGSKQTNGGIHGEESAGAVDYHDFLVSHIIYSHFDWLVWVTTSERSF